MSLQKLPNLNQIPADLLETIPVLEPGQRATFRSLKTDIDFDAELGTSTVIYPRLFIGYRDTIRYKGESIRIGIPKTIEDGKVTSFLSEVHGSGGLFPGFFHLFGDNNSDQEKYTFLMLSNLRKGNPYRDKSITPIIEFVDEVKENKADRKNRSVLKDALSIAIGLSLSDVREIICALNMNEFQDETILRNTVERYAEENPAVFIQSFKNPAFKLSAQMRRAHDKGIIMWDAASRKVKWVDAKNTLITVIEKSAGDEWLMAFAEYCIATQAGMNVTKEIKKRLRDSGVEGVETGSE